MGGRLPRTVVQTHSLGLSGFSFIMESLTSGRLFGYLARRPGNRALPHGAPGEELARDTCKW